MVVGAAVVEEGAWEMDVVIPVVATGDEASDKAGEIDGVEVRTTITIKFIRNGTQ